LFFDKTEISMSRGIPAAPIPMTKRQNRLLKEHARKQKISYQLTIRLQILLKASQGINNSQVKWDLGISLNKVKLWRSRWCEAYESLCAFEVGIGGEGVSDNELLQRMLEVLKDRPRAGAPKRITLAQEQQIIALACEKPEDYGIPVTQWNREMLAHVAKAKGIVETISPRTVSKLLKK